MQVIRDIINKIYVILIDVCYCQYSTFSYFSCTTIAMDICIIRKALDGSFQILYYRSWNTVNPDLSDDHILKH